MNRIEVFEEKRAFSLELAVGNFVFDKAVENIYFSTSVVGKEIIYSAMVWYKA
ncbi:hypothetical protein [Streptococcus sp. zg-JUN1979]|uniref:hypothetical protein n=1 Tax=Streptococcus sp. zg-JUN1979 TaxID=3391450 RepID=UPI0039A539AA